MSKRAKRITYLCIIFFALLTVVFLIIPRVLVLILPFVIGYMLAGIIEPGVVFLTERGNFPRKISAALCVAAVTGGLLTAISLGSMRIYGEIKYLLSHADDINMRVSEFLGNIKKLTNAVFGLQPDFGVMGKNISEHISGNIGPVVEKIVAFLKKLPSALVFTVALVLSTYFISADRKKVEAFLKNIIPSYLREPLKRVKKRMGEMFRGYLKAQLFMMLIILFVCTLGFLIIGGDSAKYALILGICISIIDVLPVLGAGGVLIPWSLYSFLISESKMGVALLVLYGVLFGVRQIFEPKIVGKEIGLHPLGTLIGMYAGLHIFGFFGILLGPVLIIITKNLAGCGVFKYIKGYISGGETNEKI